MNEPTSPLALRPREAAKALGISPRLLWQLTKDGASPVSVLAAVSGRPSFTRSPTCKPG
jgi:hypothetical protein